MCLTGMYANQHILDARYFRGHQSATARENKNSITTAFVETGNQMSVAIPHSNGWASSQIRFEYNTGALS